MVRGKPHAWDPVRCLDWAKKFLAFLRDTVTPVSLDTRPAARTEPSSASSEARDQSPVPSHDSTTETTSKAATVTVWRVTFTPGTGVSISQLDQAGVEEVQTGKERVGFLPKWYFDELRDGSEGTLRTELKGGAGQGEERDVEKAAGEAESKSATANVEDGSGSGSGSVGALPSGWQI